MQLAVLKKIKRYEVNKLTSYGIQTFGEQNDYPQSLMEIVASSVTGSGCVKRYAEFINGKGFKNEDIAYTKVNRLDRADDLLQKVAKDYAMFNGFALVVNYNANYRISSVYHVPFEHVRICLPNENGFTTQYALHPDWGKRNTNLKRFDSSDIKYLPVYNPNPQIIEDEVIECGGWENFSGQLFYYSSNGQWSYPLPRFDASLTDMNTEEGISNITNRNARNNFLPSGMLVDICHRDQTEDEEEATESLLKEYQGDSNALKLMYAQVENKDEVPQFVEFKSQNYDKEYTASRDAVKDSIGRSFNQPPILRAENVNSGFSTTEMVASYNYYNSVTTAERMVVERVFDELFSHWWAEGEYDCTIEPLTYDVEMTLAEQLGDKLSQMLEVVKDQTLTNAQKRGIVRMVFGLNEEQINSILPL